MKRDFNAWLKPASATRHRSGRLTELRAWNVAHAKADAMRFGQSRLDISDEMDVEKDKARNDADVAKDARLSRTQGLDAVLVRQQARRDPDSRWHRAPTSRRAPAIPIVAVPFGLVPNAPHAGVS